MSTGALIAVLAAAIVGLATVALERWFARRQELARERREAYARYLIAQQALRDILAALVPPEPSYLDLVTEEGASSSTSIDVTKALEIWTESGAAEMHVRLIAKRRVFEALERFEKVAGKTTAAIRKHKTSGEKDTTLGENWQHEQDVLKQWQVECRKLIDAMRAELHRRHARVAHRRYGSGDCLDQPTLEPQPDRHDEP